MTDKIPRRRAVTKARRKKQPGSTEPFEDLPQSPQDVPKWLNEKYGVPLSPEGRPVGIGLEVANGMAISILVNPEKLLELEKVAAVRKNHLWCESHPGKPIPAKLEGAFRKIEARRLRLQLALLEKEVPAWVRKAALVTFIRALRAFPAEWPTPQSQKAVEDFMATTCLPPGSKECVEKLLEVQRPFLIKAIQLPMPALAALAWMEGLIKRPREGSVTALIRLLGRHRQV